MPNEDPIESPGTQHSVKRLRFRTDIPFKQAKEELVDPFEREYIIAQLERHSLNISAASRASGLSRKHLRHLMHKHGIGTERMITQGDYTTD